MTKHTAQTDPSGLARMMDDIPDHIWQAIAEAACRNAERAHQTQQTFPGLVR